MVTLEEVAAPTASPIACASNQGMFGEVEGDSTTVSFAYELEVSSDVLLPSVTSIDSIESQSYFSTSVLVCDSPLFLSPHAASTEASAGDGRWQFSNLRHLLSFSLIFQ